MFDKNNLKKHTFYNKRYYLWTSNEYDFTDEILNWLGRVRRINPSYRFPEEQNNAAVSSCFIYIAVITSQCFSDPQAAIIKVCHPNRCSSITRGSRQWLAMAVSCYSYDDQATPCYCYNPRTWRGNEIRILLMFGLRFAFWDFKDLNFILSFYSERI